MYLSLVMLIYVYLLVTAILFYGMALKGKVKYITILFCYLTIDLVVSILSVLLIDLSIVRNNLFLFHLFTPIEYSLLTYLYIQVISSSVLKKVLWASIPFFILLSVIFSQFIQGLKINNSYMSIIESVLLICWTLFFMREILLLKQVTVLYKYPLFWISVGILVYFTESLVIEGLLAYMVSHSPELARKVYRLGFIFSYLFLLSLIVGAFCQIVTAKQKETQVN
jgi:hypothetical protein